MRRKGILLIVRKDIEESLDANQEEYTDLSKNLIKKIEWFKDQKIGVIFHFGLYSQAGIVESWQLSREDTWARKSPWRQNLTQLREDYWNLAKQFKPEHFDANLLAKVSRKAGFKYAIFTTKHHDGFNMYNTRQSNYSITEYTGRDLFGEYAYAFHKENIGVGAYYSKADWHCPYYWQPESDPVGRYASYDPLKQPKTWNKFNKFVENQLLELCSNYGSIDILWLDGGWVNRKNNEFLNMDAIVSKLRKKQPNLLVVDRTIGGRYENYVTPERKVPDIPPKKAWESNIPLAKNWGYVPNDVYKSFEEILATVLKIVSLGGNVVLGVGPKPDGSLPSQATKLMNQLGKWLGIFGEGIYETRPTNFKIDGWFFTRKKDIIYGFTQQNVNPNSLREKILTKRIKNILPLSNDVPSDSPYVGYKIELDDLTN